MKKINFVYFCSLFVVSMVTVTLNSCHKDDDDKIKDPHEGVIINGVKWATCNVAASGTFAQNPEDAGMFYQWNVAIGWSATDPTEHIPVKNWNAIYSTATEWEITCNVCPAGWRVPTRVELESLFSSIHNETSLNGVNGREFGKGNNTIFLPAVGFRFDCNGALLARGICGSYWSSTAYDANYAYVMDFHSAEKGTYYTNKSYGCSVRCVAE